MPEVGITQFDENGKIKITKVEVTKEQMGANCWLPARFLGGTCDRFYICRYAEKAECEASASKLAREKVKHEELEEGEEIRDDLICACCGEVIMCEAGECPYCGDEGTIYEGKPVCDICYDDDEPDATIYFGDSDEPQIIGSCRNETEGQFRGKWHSTDPWRGYFVLESEDYVQIFDDAILSG